MIQPVGFIGFTARVGLKDQSDDFMIIASEGPSVSAALFTQSRFAGCSVRLSQSASPSSLRGVVTMAKNANVATGRLGLDNAREIQSTAARLVDCSPGELAIASTGVIGVQYPMESV